ncbi:MAG: YeeE/YedE family protein [Burkholderiales bacterium]
MDTTFTPVSGFLGGTLIGLAAVLLLLANGRIAGVSGIVGGIMSRTQGDVSWRVSFVVGLWLGALIYWAARAQMFDVETVAPWPVMLIAGLLVGFGTRMGSGCTSGHGVCGIARFSKRSTVATVVFMAAGIATVFVTRHLLY